MCQGSNLRRSHVQQHTAQFPLPQRMSLKNLSYIVWTDDIDEMGRPFYPA